MYKVTINDGIAEFEATESYIFTDSDGRFTTEALIPGLYGFDILYGDEWILALFEVENRSGETDLLQNVVQGEIEHEIAIPVIYTGYVTFSFDSVMSSDEFFSMIFGGTAV